MAAKGASPRLPEGGKVDMTVKFNSYHRSYNGSEKHKKMLAKKIIASIATVSTVLTMAGASSFVGAATAAELQSQIQALQSQLQTLLGQLNGGTTTTTTTTTTSTGSAPADCAGVTFNTNLTIGSTGPSVKCLQAILNESADTQVAATGAGSPGAESTYFGAKTKAAVAAFQLKNAATILTPVGLTAGTGFVGASTRAALNAMIAGGTAVTPVTPVTGNLPAGCTSTSGYSPVTGQACSGTTTTTTTTTTTGGPEGSITVSTNPTPANNTKVYEGDSKVAVYGLKIKATGSDMDVQRVTLEFSSQPYTYFTNIYLYNGSTQLATEALNSTTVSKVSATDYEITLANFASKFVVPNNTTGVLTVEVDVQGGISTGVYGTSVSATAGTCTGSSTTSCIVINQPNGTSVRAVDQAGLNQYSGDQTGRIVSVNASQTTGASMTVSLDANTPKARNVIADSSQNITGATLLTFDVQATKDNLLIDTLNADFTIATSTKNVAPNTAYLYDDSGTVVGTGSPSTTTGVVSFTDLNYTVSKDTTKTFTIRIDDTIGAANATTHVGSSDGEQYVVTIPVGGVTFEKSNGVTSTSTGSAASYAAYAYAEGPIFTVASISTSSTQPTFSGSTSTLSATFNIQVQAVTGDVYIPNSTSNAFAIDYGKNSVAQSATGVSVTYTQPSGTTVSGAFYKVGQGTSATFAVGATYTRNDTAGAFYDLRMESIAWNHIGSGANISSTYMANDSNWISQQVSLQ